MRKFLIILLLYPLALSAQEKIDGQQFINRVMIEFSTHQADPSKGPRIPMIERYEFRTESHDFDFDEQEYLFRVTPNNPHKREAQKNMLQHMGNKSNWELLEYECDIYEQTHRDWISLMEKTLLLDIYKEEQQLLQERKKVNVLKEARLEVDIKEKIDLSSELTKNTIKIAKVQASIDLLRKEYDLSSKELSFEDTPTLAYLILKLNPNLIEQSLSEKELDYDSIEIEREIDLEKAEKKQFFDFFQVRYQGPKIDPLEERVAIGVGFILENSGDSKLDLEKLRLEKEELMVEKKIKKQKKANSFRKAYDRLHSEYAEYNYILSQHEKHMESLINLEQKIKSRTDYNPIHIFEIKKQVLDYKKGNIESRIQIYDLYFDYLAKSGTFCPESVQLFN